MRHQFDNHHDMLGLTHPHPHGAGLNKEIVMSHSPAGKQQRTKQVPKIFLFPGFDESEVNLNNLEQIIDPYVRQAAGKCFWHCSKMSVIPFIGAGQL